MFLRYSSQLDVSRTTWAKLFGGGWIGTHAMPRTSNLEKITYVVDVFVAPLCIHILNSRIRRSLEFLVRANFPRRLVFSYCEADELIAVRLKDQGTSP